MQIILILDFLISSSLHKYINSAVSGLPDVIPLDEGSRDVLFGAYKALMEQVDKDATPELLNELKNTIRRGGDGSIEYKFTELSKCLSHPHLNPLALPFSYLFNGVIPDFTNNEKTDPSDVDMENEGAGNTSSEITCKAEANTQVSNSKIQPKPETNIS